MVKNLARDLEIDCDLNPGNKSTLTALRGEEGLTEMDFRCSMGIIDDSKKEGYSVTCKLTKKDCPIYPHLLEQASGMSQEEYEAIGSR